MSERVPETPYLQLQRTPDPDPAADAADPPLDLHAGLAAVRFLLERRGHSGLTEETVTTAPAARNPAHTAPTRHAPGTGFSTTGFSTPGFSTPGSSTPGLTVRRRESPLEAAVREAREELGVPDLEVHPVPVQLDRHELSSAFGRCRAHLDVRFLAVAPADAVPVRSAESRAVGWAEVDHLPPTAVPDLVGALGYARAALARL